MECTFRGSDTTHLARELCDRLQALQDAIRSEGKFTPKGIPSRLKVSICSQAGSPLSEVNLSLSTESLPRLHKVLQLFQRAHPASVLQLRSKRRGIWELISQYAEHGDAGIIGHITRDGERIAVRAKRGESPAHAISRVSRKGKHHD